MSCALAGCGGDAPSADEIIGCLRDAGATVEADPPDVDDTMSAEFTPELTPGTEHAARGEIGDGTRIDVFDAPGGEADRAEDRALEFLRLFGVPKENLIRSGSTLVMVRGPGTRSHVVPAGDLQRVRTCTK